MTSEARSQERERETVCMKLSLSSYKKQLTSEVPTAKVLPALVTDQDERSGYETISARKVSQVLELLQ